MRLSPLLVLLVAAATLGGASRTPHDDPQTRAPATVDVRYADAAARRLQIAAPLRLVFNTEVIDGDGRSCSAPGEYVQIGSPSGGHLSNPCSANAGADLLPVEDCYFACTAADVVSATQRARLEDIILPAVAAWFGAALAIERPVVGNLPVSTVVPCGFSGEVAVPAHLAAGGSPETDVLLFVTVRPVAATALAFAGYCQQDGGQAAPSYVPARPTVGHVNVRPSVLDGDEAEWGSTRRVENVLALLAHEVMHALGFTISKLREFPCPQAPASPAFLLWAWRPPERLPMAGARLQPPRRRQPHAVQWRAVARAGGGGGRPPARHEPRGARGGARALRLRGDGGAGGGPAALVRERCRGVRGRRAAGGRRRRGDGVLALGGARDARRADVRLRDRHAGAARHSAAHTCLAGVCDGMPRRRRPSRT
jgi:hypothetical protein